jgi:hypothetical protein
LVDRSYFRNRPRGANAVAEKAVKNGNFGDPVFSLSFFNMPSSVFKTRHKFRPVPIRIIEEEIREASAYRLAEASRYNERWMGQENLSAGGVR